MEISNTGLELIEASEGLATHVYDDDAGVPTIGCGHKLLPGESFPDGITKEQAIALLLQDVENVERALTSLIPYTCTQGQFDALCDFGFNFGIDNLRAMLSHGWSQVPVQILRWVNAGGKPQPGMVMRRQAELALWNESSVPDESALQV
jgi:lysozyme